MREPVDPRTAARSRLLVDVLDQCSTYAFTAQAGRHEQVLKVTIIRGGPKGTVLDVMDEADRRGVAPGERPVHGLGRSEQSCPRDGGDRRWDVRLVEGLIAPPQRHPR